MLQFSQCIHAEEDEVWNLITIHYLTPLPPKWGKDNLTTATTTFIYPTAACPGWVLENIVSAGHQGK